MIPGGQFSSKIAAKLPSQTIDIACEAQSAKERNYFRKPLILLGSLAKRKLPHTPCAHARPSMARACACRSANKELNMTFDLTSWDASRCVGPAKPRWSPRCAVCGDLLGREVTLDVMVEHDGGSFRLTCMRRDNAHAEGVSRHYELSADYAPGQIIGHVALKTWADPGRVAATVIGWLLAYCLIQAVPRQEVQGKVGTNPSSPRP